MCLKCQSKIQLCFESVFSKWASVVVRCTLVVFLVSLVVFIACGKLNRTILSRAPP